MIPRIRLWRLWKGKGSVILFLLKDYGILESRRGGVTWSIGSSPILRTGAEEAFFHWLEGNRMLDRRSCASTIYHNSNKQLNILNSNLLYCFNVGVLLGQAVASFFDIVASSLIIGEIEHRPNCQGNRMLETDTSLKESTRLKGDTYALRTEGSSQDF